MRCWIDKVAKFALLSFVAVAGCSEDTPGIEQARDDMTPLVAAACDWMYGCCASGELRQQLGGFTPNAANCTDRMVDAIEAGVPHPLLQPGLSDGQAQLLLVLARSIGEGRVDVQGDAVEACAQATRALECNEFVEAGPMGRCTPDDEAPENPCDPELMFVGKQTVGEECEAPWECGEGLRCIDFGIIAVCADPAEEGENCFSDAECAEDLVCEYSTGTCRPGAARGQPCAFADPENPIPGTESIRCEVGLVCDPVALTCTGGFCTPGAPCGDIFGDSDCPEGLFCIGEPLQTTCRPPGPAGAVCNKNEDCESAFCDQFLMECAPLLPDGSPCNISSECISGFCDPGIGCSPQVPNGQPCMSFSSDECMDGFCDTSQITPTCTPWAGIGGPCPFGQECNPADDLVCIDMTCQMAPFPNGVMCFDGSQCQSGVCFPDVCTDGTPIGGACDTTGLVAPCVLGAFCDIPEGQTMGACAMLRATGEDCDRSEQCWGACTVRFGALMCDATPATALDQVWCDGN